MTTCLISAVFVGCSSSNTDTGSTPPPVQGGFGATGLAGSTAGSGGAGAPMSVPCGATTCTNPAGALLGTLKMFLPNAMLATPCCDAATTTCGWVTGGTCTVPPPKKNCPAPAAIPGIGAGLSACCNASNTCGVDAYAIGMGCMAAFGGGTPANCDTGVAPGGGTAGSSAAGSSAAGSSAAGTTGAAGAAGAHAGTGGGAAGSSAGSGAAGAHAGSGGSGTAGTHAGAGGH